MPKEVQKQGESSINTENIFDEFVESRENIKDIQSADKWRKDLYDYIKTGNYVFMMMNIFLFFLIIIFSFYNYFQAKDDNSSISFLQPVCSFFLWEVNSSVSECQSVTSVLAQYNEKKSNLEEKTWNVLVGLMSEVYGLNNFNYSKKVTFLLDQTNSRLKPLRIISDFDEIKKEFTSSFERSNVTCADIQILNNSDLRVNCSVFSSDWDTSIIDLRDGVRSILSGGGTSISRASSFVNFIENHSSWLFTVVENPSVLISSPTIEEGPYTQMTTVDLVLRYTNPEYLSF